MCRIEKANLEDLDEILRLQYLAYQSEAALFENIDIPPLTQTIDEVTEEYAQGLILKMIDDDGAIIGSVREILGSGSFLDYKFIQGDGILIFVLAPGAFIVFGFTVALVRYLQSKKKAS